ncbi:hypothetical protein F7C95_13010 [Opitutia bacterium ISCC 51]|nr:hypothetical protein F7C95_13010 [Opitutae bacterium ISCC 51]QXD26934.1 hypothetical protein GA003_12935 [Opitutae bacterium ISCC 52]
MASKSSKLEWLVASLQDDMNWWVIEVSKDIPWDLDGLGIIDPKQWSFLVDLLDPLREYGLDIDIVEDAFVSYGIDKDLGDQKIRMVPNTESLFETEEIIFVLPDVLDDDETGPYADFLDHITTLRVKLLNDLIDFEQSMSTSELEEDLRDELNNMHFEGKNLHYFTEITSILDYTPAGYSLDDDVDDDDEKSSDNDEEVVEDIPDLEEANEVIKEDDTMKWEEEEEEEDLEEPTAPPDLAEEDMDPKV